MPKIALLFPGQGSQYVGMGKALSGRFEAARIVYKEADSVLGWEISRLCFEGPEEELNQTAKTQPAILTTSIAAWKVLESGMNGETGFLERFSFVAGHSLGEYTALVVSGGLRFADAVALVEKRGQYMQQAVPKNSGAMLAILGLEKHQVEEVCRQASTLGVVSPANLNCPGQVVIAGGRAAVERAAVLAKDKGAKKVIPLAVSVPSHCALMEPACQRLQEVLESTFFSDLSVPLVNNAEARMLTSAAEVRESLVTQLRSPLLWEDSIRLMMSRGVEAFVEVGPSRVLSGLVRKIDREVRLFNVEDANSLEKTVEELKALWN
jgi:[acyl-carrier-protein] S-malonyltransferase